MKRTDPPTSEASPASRPAADAGSAAIGATGRRGLALLFSDSCLYGMAAAVNKLLSLFTLPILTRLFSNSEFGAADAIAVFGGASTLLMTLGQDSALARLYYETDDEAERRQIVAQSLLIELVLCVVVTGLLLVFAAPITAALLGSTEYVLAFRLLAAAFPFVVVFHFCRNLLKWTFSRWAFNLLSLGSAAGIVTLTIVLAVGLGWRVEGVFAAQLATYAVGAVWSVWLCRRHLVRPANLACVGPLLRLGWPYMLMAVTSALIPALDRVLVSRYLGLDALGPYAAGAKLALLVALPVQAFQMAWGPFSYSIYRQPGAIETFNQVLRAYTSAIVLLLLLLVAAAEPLLILLASARYASGAWVVLPLGLTVAIRSFGWITGLGIDLAKKPHWSMLDLSLELLVSATAMWLAVESLGVIGVAWGVLLGQVARAVCVTAVGHCLWPMQFAWPRPLTASLLAVGFGLALQAAPGWESPQGIAVRAGLVLTCASCCWYWVLAGQERQLIRDQLRVWARRPQDHLRRASRQQSDLAAARRLEPHKLSARSAPIHGKSGVSDGSRANGGTNPPALMRH